MAQVPSDEDFWVFGYGSLMWNPGFPHVETKPARLIGAHRSLCVYSFVHRGTEERPGLVLGLDRGGSCRGLAFKVKAEDREAVVAYLRAREQVTRVYKEAVRQVVFADGRGHALVYLVDRTHQQYAGVLDAPHQLEIVRHAHGQSGPNTDYVVSTAQHLRDMGVVDRHLFWLAEELEHHRPAVAGESGGNQAATQ
ncbi:gamma-glutamylcyclotransferase [Afifella sp. JA880]|uniref:gamma-glutamylcyclotransferase n=1 Tax=Afifella sp. JA880 TaxID=2975280 RepID=UPI0021BAB05F|nr:gamma-glutamylcyclotransferase [Afifella sp. JA880]MCT8268416.1 gamma-glutamylcyclotransferase [Afifella sp. JA880]